MLLKFGVVGKPLGMCVSLDERVMEDLKLGVCEGWWFRSCDAKFADACDGGIPVQAC